jgi:hypothetical protein
VASRKLTGLLYIVGTPVEVYTYGTQYWMIWIGYLTMIFLVTHMFVPVCECLSPTSVFKVCVLRNFFILIHAPLFHFYAVLKEKN